jgi:5-methylcytosine-specific restriction protein B
MPDRAVVVEQAPSNAVEFFDRLADVFIQNASDEMLDLLPGHSYYLAASEVEFKKRMRYDLLPLLDEYLRQGLLGPMASELHSVRDEIDDYANRA